MQKLPLHQIFMADVPFPWPAQRQAILSLGRHCDAPTPVTAENKQIKRYSLLRLPPSPMEILAGEKKNFFFTDIHRYPPFIHHIHRYWLKDLWAGSTWGRLAGGVRNGPAGRLTCYICHLPIREHIPSLRPRPARCLFLPLYA